MAGKCDKTYIAIAGGDSPLEYLSNDQEAESDGYSSPEVPWFREDFAIVVLQISPAVAFGKPNPVRPYQLIQPGQHPKDETVREKDLRVFFVSCGRKLRGNKKKSLSARDLHSDFSFHKFSNSLSCDNILRGRIGNREG